MHVASILALGLVFMTLLRGSEAVTKKLWSMGLSEEDNHNERLMDKVQEGDGTASQSASNSCRGNPGDKKWTHLNALEDKDKVQEGDGTASQSASDPCRGNPGDKKRTYLNALEDKMFPPLRNDLVLRAARGEQTERVPVWVMRQAGRYLPEYMKAKGDRKFFATCRDPELVSELTIQPIDRFELDAAIIFSDILVIPIALGLKVANDPGQGPVFADPISDPKDIDRLNPDFDTQQELGYVYEAITLTRTKLQGRVPLLGFAGAPFTLLKFMIENVSAGPNPNKARRFLVEHPEAGERVLEILTGAVVKHLVAQIKAGAQMVQVFDSYAGELGPGLFHKLELPCLRKIAFKTKEKVAELGLEPVPMIVFAKDAHFALEDLTNIGYEVVGLDWSIQPMHARNLTSSRVTLQGNMDPVMLFATKEEIQQTVREMLKKFGTQKYIANLGHGVLKDTDPDHLGVFVDAVHSYSEDMNAIA